MGVPIESRRVPMMKYLIARKTLLTKLPVAGKDLVVYYEVYNVGSSTAYNVALTDSSWPEQQFDLHVGTQDVVWDRIPPATNVSHTFVLRPKVHGEVGIGPSTVTFQKSISDPSISVAHSTMIGYLPIRSSREASKIGASGHFREWFKFVLLAAGPVLGPYLVWNVIQGSYKDGLAKKNN